MISPGSDYFVQYIPLPHHVGGLTMVNPDGTYTIYINSNKPKKEQLHAFFHEHRHIEMDHFHRDDLTDEEKEADADAFADHMVECFIRHRLHGHAEG